MSVVEFFGVLRRNWVFTVLALVVGTLLSSAYITTVVPSYSVQGTYLLADPDDPEDEDGRSQTDLAANIIAQVLNPTGQPVALADTGADYQASALEAAAVVTISVEGATVEAVDQSLTLLLDQAEVLVEGLGGGDPIEISDIELRLLSRNDPASVSVGEEPLFRSTAAFAVVESGQPAEQDAPIGANAETSEILIEAIEDRPVDGGEFELGMDPEDVAPLLYTSATATSRNVALAAHEQGVESMREIIGQLTGSTDEVQILAVRGPNEVFLSGQRTRFAIALGALTIAVAVVLAFVAESVPERRWGTS